jgi:hypothetical protein
VSRDRFLLAFVCFVPGFVPHRSRKRSVLTSHPQYHRTARALAAGGRNRAWQGKAEAGSSSSFEDRPSSLTLTIYSERSFSRSKHGTSGCLSPSCRTPRMTRIRSRKRVFFPSSATSLVCFLPPGLGFRRSSDSFLSLYYSLVMPVVFARGLELDGFFMHLISKCIAGGQAHAV